MIDITTKFLYHLVVNAQNVNFLDYFRFAYYSNFHGSVPPLFKEQSGRTVLIDLYQPVDVLFQQMKSNYRNEVRRAEKEEIKFETEKDICAFVKYYNAFALQKGLKKISSYQIEKYRDYFLTKAVWNDKVLSMHACFIDAQQSICYLLYSASNRLSNEEDSKLIGYANKFLHFSEFKMCKELNLKYYDFSGIVEDPENKQEYGIGLFKKGFGGNIVTTKHCTSPFMTFLLRFISR